MQYNTNRAKTACDSGVLAHTFKYGGVPEWPKGADCKSVASRFGGSNPPSSTKKATDLSVAFLMKFVLRTSEIASL